MKVVCDVPCGLDPKVIAECMKLAWRIFKLRTGQGPKSLPDIRQIKTRKGMNDPWCRRGGAVVWINSRMTQRAHAAGWAYALLTGNDFVPGTWRDNERALLDAMPDALVPKAPKKVKPTKRELATVEKLAKAREAVAEWEQKRKDANRSLRLAKTKLRSYKAQVRALERSVRENAPREAIGYDPKAFAAHMRERIGGAS